MKAFTQASFQTFLDEGKLMGARCESCGETFVPPRPICPQCHGAEMTWEQMSGQGTLAAFTVVHIGPTAMIEAGYDRKNLYCTGVVTLDEGPSISAQIVGVDTAQPEQIEIGTPLSVTFIERGVDDNKHAFLAFTA